jgi:hypothetical protein
MVHVPRNSLLSRCRSGHWMGLVPNAIHFPSGAMGQAAVCTFSSGLLLRGWLGGRGRGLWQLGQARAENLRCWARSVRSAQFSGLALRHCHGGTCSAVASSACSPVRVPAPLFPRCGWCCLTCFALSRWPAPYPGHRTVSAPPENSMEEAQYIRGPADSARINLDEERELLYWTKLLGVSETKLRAAVAFAGIMASDVRAYLGLPSAQGAVASHGLDGPESCFSSPSVPPTSASRPPGADIRSLADFARFSHIFGRAR